MTISIGHFQFFVRTNLKGNVLRSNETNRFYAYQYACESYCFELMHRCWWSMARIQQIFYDIMPIFGSFFSFWKWGFLSKQCSITKTISVYCVAYVWYLTRIIYSWKSKEYLCRKIKKYCKIIKKIISKSEKSENFIIHR